MLTVAEVDAWADAYVRAQTMRDTDAVAADPELWSAINRFMLPADDVNPEECWAALLAVLRRTTDEWVLGMLAAGPLEDLLQYAGARFIERIETEAVRNTTFCWMLGQISPSGPPEVWARVLSIRKTCDAK